MRMKGDKPSKDSGRKVHKRALGLITQSPQGLYGTWPSSYHPSEGQAAWRLTPGTPAVGKAE